MLRRRMGKDEVPPSDTVSGTKHENEQLHAEFVDTKVTQLVIKPRSKRRNGFIFLLGGIFGIFIALFFANQQEVISLDSLMELNLDSWIEALPQGILSDVKEFSVRAFKEGVLFSLPLVAIQLTSIGGIATRTRHRQL